MNAHILLVISVAVLQAGLAFAGYFHPSYDRYVKYGIDYWWKREKEFLKQWERPPPKPINCPTPPMPYPQPGAPGVGPTPPGPQAYPGAGVPSGPEAPSGPGGFPGAGAPSGPQATSGAGAFAVAGASSYSQYPGNNQFAQPAQSYRIPPRKVASRPAAKYPAKSYSKSKPYRG